jgi:subtilisin-like proprotein convertase family protein
MPENPWSHGLPHSLSAPGPAEPTKEPDMQLDGHSPARLRRVVAALRLPNRLRGVLAPASGLVVAAMCGALLLATGPAIAAVPVTITVHGLLSSGAGGVAADGNYSLTFALYDTKVGGKAAWQEGPVTISAAGGRFMHALGTGSPLAAKQLAAMKSAWLGVTVSKDPELPRQRLRSVAYALAAQQSLALSCSGCVTAAHLAAGVLDGVKLGKGSVKSDNVAFNYAASKIKGGPAALAADLQCTGCVSVSEMKIDGDIDMGEFVLKAGKGVFGIVTAQTVIANSFLGDGSKLTGIKTPAGSCSKAGEVVKGIKADGSLNCVAAMDPKNLPVDGLDEISNGLLSNQFSDKVASENTPLKIKDNNPVGVSDEILFPDIGLAQQFAVHIDLVNSNISKLMVKLFDPNNAEYLLYDGKGTGKALKTSWPAPTKPASGDLGSWVGKNPKGKWRLVVTDNLFFDNVFDGQIKAWSIEIKTLSNKKVAAIGTMRMPGGSVLQVADKEPVVCDASMTGYLYYDAKERLLRVCNGTKFDLIETLPGGPGSKGQPGKSCQAVLAQDKGATTGVYWLDTDGAGGPAGKFQAWCDMKTAGGGWVLVMQIKSGQTTTFGYGSSYWTSPTATTTAPPAVLSSVNAKYGVFNTFLANSGQVLLRDKTTANFTVLEVPGMKGKTLLDRFQTLGGKKSNPNEGATLKLIAGKGSPQELMNYPAPTAMCSQKPVKWRMNMLSSHSGVRIGNDVASNAQTTNNASSWACYDHKTNLSFSGVGGTLEGGRQFQDSYGSEALNRYRSNGGTGQGSQKGVEIYVR